MIPELQIFSNSDYEPFAVFYWGTEDYGLTAESARQAFVDMYDWDEEFSGEMPEGSEPKLFYLVENGEYSEDNEPRYIECCADTKGAKPCFGVIFDSV